MSVSIKKYPYIGIKNYVSYSQDSYIIRNCEVEHLYDSKYRFSGEFYEYRKVLKVGTIVNYRKFLFFKKSKQINNKEDLKWAIEFFRVDGYPFNLIFEQDFVKTILIRKNVKSIIALPEQSTIYDNFEEYLFMDNIENSGYLII